MTAMHFDAATHEARTPPDACAIADLRGRLEYLPAAMRQARRWLLWKPGKVPSYVSGTQRNGTLDTPHDVAQLATLDDALDRLESDSRFAGLGFALGFDAALGAHWQGLDLDDALEPAGQFTTERARQLYQTSDGYAEVSPSGRGLHVIGLGARFRAIKWYRPGEQKIELYSAQRYFTVSGRMMREGAPVDLAPLAERVRAALVASGKHREHKAREHVNGSAAYLDRMPANLQIWVKAHSIEAALAEHGYQRIGDRWLSPRSESGIPGVTVLDDLRAVTFHASDAGIGTEVESDGEVFNAFDAAVRYTFGGDRIRAMRELLPRTGQEGAGAAQTGAEDAEHQRNADGGAEAASDDAPRLLDLAALAQREPDPPAFIVPDWLPAGEVTLFAAHGGTGKSATALRLAVCLTVGRDWHGLPVEPRCVDFISFEDAEPVIHWRLQRICQALGVMLADVAVRLRVFDATKCASGWYSRGQYGDTGPTAAFHDMAQIIGGPGRVVMVDGSSDTFAGNENDRAQVKAFIRLLRRLVSTDGALLLIAHVDKLAAKSGADSLGFSGSTGWNNGVRCRWFMFSESDEEGTETGNLVLEVRKSNLGRTGGRMVLAFDDARGTFERIDSEPPRRGKAFQRADEADSIVAVIRAAWAAGDPIPAASSGTRTAHSVAEAREMLPASLKGRTGRKRFYRALEELRAAGAVRVELSKRTNRHAVEVLNAPE